MEKGSVQKLDTPRMPSVQVPEVDSVLWQGSSMARKGAALPAPPTTHTLTQESHRYELHPAPTAPGPAALTKCGTSMGRGCH